MCQNNDVENQSRSGAGRPPSHSDLEVDVPSYSYLPEATPTPSLCPMPKEHYNEKIVKGSVDNDTDKIAYDTPPNPIARKSRVSISRKRLYIIVAVVILVIIAAVVGTAVGVLKSKQRSDKSNSADNESSNVQDGDSNGTGSLIWNQTDLAVTGWRYNDGKDFSMRLFYQDAEGNLRISAMESGSKENWTAGTNFTKAKKGTPLAVACNNQSIYEPKKSV